MDLADGEAIHIGRHHEVGDALRYADGGVRAADEHVELGDAAVADVVLLTVDDPVLPVLHRARSDAESGAFFGDEVLGTHFRLRHPDGEVEVVILQKRGQEFRTLRLVPDDVEEMDDLPGLVERDGHAQIAPADLLAHDAEREDVGPAAAYLLGDGERPQAQPAPGLENIPGEPLGGVGDPLARVGVGLEFVSGVVVRQFLQFKLSFREGEIHCSPLRLK